MIEVENIQELHKEAMDLAEMAFIAKLKGDYKNSEKFLREAYKKESSSAKLLMDEFSFEPTRSILCRSAASLAIECNDLRGAERLIALGLAGNPPEEIAEELRDLLERVNFQRHLDTRDISLENGDIQMSIAGNAVSDGIVPADEFVKRIGIFRTLFYRTLERKRGKKFQERGSLGNIIRERPIFISTPRIGSFAISVKFGSPNQLEFFNDSYEVANEVLLCLGLFNESKENELESRIPDSTYRRNFIGLAKDIYPDGDRINLVGFTSMQNGQQRKLSLTKTQIEVRSSFRTEIDDNANVKQITIKGILKFADATKDSKIKLVDENGKSHTIIVPEGMLSDIVKPKWEDTVTVTGFLKNRVIHLIDID